MDAAADLLRRTKIEIAPATFVLVRLTHQDWTRLLAAAGVPIGALTAYSRDHLLIKQTDLGAALRALGPHVAELC